MQSFDTVVEAITRLREQGYINDFNLAFDKLICSKGQICLEPGDFEIVAVFRFEGDTNPSDEDVVYVVESKDGKVKGLFTGAYGTYADNLSGEMLKKISMHA